MIESVEILEQCRDVLTTLERCRARLEFAALGEVDGAEVGRLIETVLSDHRETIGRHDEILAAMIAAGGEDELDGYRLVIAKLRSTAADTVALLAPMRAN